MSRWRPARAGICNIWRYYDEVFTFEHGRLLLRGPNGSGKSKALELLLPFLLDASTQPSRLSTFGTTSRTMHWNLMGEGATGRTRVGFVWLELQHDDGDRVTIGARLAATKESTRVDSTFFLTDARVGADVLLLDATDAPLTVAALTAGLDGHGRVFPTAAEYRTAVRERLYPGMSPDRYATLVDALLQLRRPKLSEHLDPETLSSVLSSALPPVDEMQITELAEGFERLDQQRAQLGVVERQENAARSLAAAARRHARVVLRARATALTQATTTLDRASADVRHGETRLDAARTAEAEAGAAAETAERERDELRQTRETLERSEVYREGRALDDLRERARDARKAAERSAADQAQAADQEGRARQDADVLLAAGEQQRVDVAQVLRGLVGRADALQALPAGAEAVEPPAVMVDAPTPDGAVRPTDDAPDGVVPPTDDAPDGVAAPDGRDVAAATADWAERVGVLLGDVRARAAARRAAVSDVLRLAGEHTAAVAERARAEEQVAAATTRRDAARAALAAASDAVDAAVGDHAGAVRTWAGGLAVLHLDPADVDRALDRVAAGATGLGTGSDALTDGEPADLRTLVDQARRRVLDDVTRTRAGLDQRRDDSLGEQEAVTAARDALAAATAVAPARAAWRDAPPTSGAPLWRLVDAYPGADPMALAGLEAALEAGGLLDAWVQPDGLVTLDGHDLLLAGGRGVGHASDGHVTGDDVTGRSRAGRTLLDVLRPDAEQGDVPADVVARVLASVPLGETAEQRHDSGGSVDRTAGGSALVAGPADPATSDAWVTPDGRWRLGPLHGRWTKPEAQYIGAAARERHRRERLAALESRLVEIADLLRGLSDDAAQLDARERAADQEASGLPSEGPVRTSVAALATALAHSEVRDHDLGVAVDARRQAERVVIARWAALETAAARAGVPTDEPGLSTLLDDLRTLTHDAERAEVTVRAHVTAVEGLQRALVRALDASTLLAERTSRADEDDAAAQGLERQVAELDATLGAELRRITERLAELAREIDAAHAAARRRASEHKSAGERVASLVATLASSTSRHAAAQEQREAARAVLARMLGTTLTEDADLDLGEAGREDEGTVKASLEAARAVVRHTESEHDTVGAATTRLTERRHEVAATLADRAQLEIVDTDDTVVLVAVHGGRRTSVAALRSVLAAERARMTSEITDGERALFRRVLTGETRRHVSARIRDADALVTAMNRRLATVRTASDVQVRLRWEVRDDEGGLLRRARDLLLLSPARLTEDDEQALETFLDERITRARASDDNLPWAQQLARVFDYTQWHQFRVQMTRNDASGWITLTRRVHSALSGGEKAIALHLPLFAALAAHYEATPGAPRLILLDEVFVGIDTTNRGQVLGLLRDLDLDLVLTSDHEWCAYPQVDGIAVHALATGADDDAVTSTRFVWTGTELVEDPLADGLLL